MPAVVSVLLLALALLGAPPDRELRITTPHHGVVVESLTGSAYTATLAGPLVSITLDEETRVRFDDLDRPTVSAKLGEWVTLTGSYRIELVQDGETVGRLIVREATVAMGRFDGDEGWATPGD